jgi:hypothetical protein
MVERIAALANRYRGSADVPSLIERWIDDLDIKDGFRWVERNHPCYQLTFVQHVRGQALRVFVDYHAQNDFLGLFVYLPGKFAPSAFKHVCKVINMINCDIPYGCLELHLQEGTLRFRISVDVAGVRLTLTFLEFMLKSGLQTLDNYATQLLAGQIGLVAYRAEDESNRERSNVDE